jgi:transposase
MHKIPREAMKYKLALFNQQTELLTKLRIVRLVKSGLTKTEVASVFNCHRNTVFNLIKQFESSLSLKTQQKLLLNHSLSLDEINQLMSPLKRRPSKPYHHPRQPDVFLAYLVYWLHQEKDWRVGYRMMHSLIQRRFGDTHDFWLKQLLKLTPRQIRTIYKNFNLQVKKVRTHNRQVTPLYNYASLLAFERLHFDVKVLADQHSLPTHTYQTLTSKLVPRYQWTVIDAKTRVRFVAYSYHTNAEFGFKFLLFVIGFIRFSFLNYETKIVVGVDNGSEFCSGSHKKLTEWNSTLGLLNASAYQYHPYFDVRKNLVERSHLMDDRYFLIPRGHLLVNETSFLKEVTNFFYWYNFEKPHMGEGMHHRTPYEALKDTQISFPQRLATFPILILEKEIHLIRKTVDFFMFYTEIKQKQQYYQKTLTPKQVIDVSKKYQFFSTSAQKVLTQY